MTNEPVRPSVIPLDDPGVGLAEVGGKGASLARLACAGLPVPAGFHITTDAYRMFVASVGLANGIDAALARIDDGDPATIESASAELRELFLATDMPESIEGAIRKAYAALGKSGLSVAVRSSATAEDLPEHSFAGQLDSYLNVRGEVALLAAVKRCWASLWTARAIQYRASAGIAHDGLSLAVVVQELVPADAAGVLFTINPLNARTDQVVVNGSWGLGEAVVGGLVTPDTFVIDRGAGTVVERKIASKEVMTVRTDSGTEEVAVSGDRRDAPVLRDDEVARLARLGLEVERLYGDPRDIEWASHGGKFFILQARPVTGIAEPALEEWNDSLASNSLWTSANLGEAVPDVMTPSAWSLIQIFMSEVMIGASVDEHRMYGNIGGRFYMNLSVTVTLAAAFGMSKKLEQANELVFGGLPQGMEVPLLPVSRWRILREQFGEAIRVAKRIKAAQKELPRFLSAARDGCESLRNRIALADTTTALRALWTEEIDPYFRRCCHMLQAATRDPGQLLVKVPTELRKLVGDVDADLLATGLQTDGDQLASLGPLMGLEQLARGEIDRQTYIRRYGHRSQHEFEVSLARPAEDPGWIDAQSERLKDLTEGVAELLGRQEQARTAAWERFAQRHPRKVKSMRGKIEKFSAFARRREAARTEVARVFWVLRAFLLRAGELTGHGEDVFFLSIEETLALLGGDSTSLAVVPARRATHSRYSALPTYPMLIRGRFDPFRWAAEPGRRSDYFDADDLDVPVSETIIGSPASGGVLEGIARVVLSVEDGDQIQPGEILVTTVTNIGWTPLFTRISAVVTDVGATLSHAAIVARELGIPAVVGCGNATTRIRTGDRIRIDGARGTVEVVDGAST